MLAWRRPVQKLGPDAALQPCHDTGDARGGQFDLAAYGRKTPQIGRPDKNREADIGCISIFMIFW
jgi:hypothetical protein